MSKKRHFSDKGMRHISQFADTLRRIHIRLIMEGYTIDETGKIHRPKNAPPKDNGRLHV